MLNSDGYENGKKSIGSTLLVHFFDVVLHDYNVKRPSYSSCMCSPKVFFACVPVMFAFLFTAAHFQLADR